MVHVVGRWSVYYYLILLLTYTVTKSARNCPKSLSRVINVQFTGAGLAWRESERRQSGYPRLLCGRSRFEGYGQFELTQSSRGLRKDWKKLRKEKPEIETSQSHTRRSKSNNSYTVTCHAVHSH